MYDPFACTVMHTMHMPLSAVASQSNQMIYLYKCQFHSKFIEPRETFQIACALAQESIFS